MSSDGESQGGRLDSLMSWNQRLDRERGSWPGIVGDRDDRETEGNDERNGEFETYRKNQNGGGRGEESEERK